MRLGIYQGWRSNGQHRVALERALMRALERALEAAMQALEQPMQVAMRVRTYLYQLGAKTHTLHNAVE